MVTEGEMSAQEEVSSDLSNMEVTRDGGQVWEGGGGRSQFTE